MKSKIFSTLSAAVLVLALGSMAKADSFDLSWQNGNVPGTNPWGTVTVTGDSSQVVITFTVEAGLDMFGNDAAAWNLTTTTGITSVAVTDYTVVVGAPGAPTVDNSGTVNMDGFGSGANAFDVGVAGGNGSSAGYSMIEITITGSGLTLAQFEAANGSGVQFSAQVGGYNGNTQGLSTCTGFVGTQNGGGSTQDTNVGTCTGSEVPEPGSLALFGTGIIGMAGYLRRKLLS